MTLYLPMFLKFVVVATVLYCCYLLAKFLDSSNSKFGIWLRKKFGPTVQSAGHAIQRDDLKAVGYCPGCGSAIKANQAVWLIVQIPPTDEDVVGKLTQAHCLFYMEDDVHLRVGICVKGKCREKPHKSDVLALVGEDGKPFRQTPMLGDHRPNKDIVDLFEGIPSLLPIQNSKS